MRKMIFLFLFAVIVYLSIVGYFVNLYSIYFPTKKELEEQNKIQMEIIIQEHFETEIVKGKEDLIYTKIMKVTGYAPLDPKAIKGMCYSGDPKITASGRKVQPGITVAASKNIPFGTLVFIPSLGWRIVEDRGGRIKGNRIDVCFATKKEALDWGLQEHEVYLIFPIEEDSN